MAEDYHIRLKGHLDSRWSAWFDAMTISNEANGEVVLRGPLSDQAALHGVLIKIRDLGLPLIAVYQLAADSSAEPTDGHAEEECRYENDDLVS